MNIFNMFRNLDKAASEAAREHNTDPAQMAAEYSGVLVFWGFFTIFLIAVLTGLDPSAFLQTKAITPVVKAVSLVVLAAIGLFTAYPFIKIGTKLTSVFFSTITKKNNLESIARHVIQILMWASIIFIAAPYMMMVAGLGVRSSFGLTTALSAVQITGFLVLGFFLIGIFIIFPGLLRTPYTLEELKAITIYQIAESLPERLEEFARKNPNAALHITWLAVLPDHLDPITDDILSSLSEQGRLEIERAKVTGAQMGFSKAQNQVVLGPPKRS